MCNNETYLYSKNDLDIESANVKQYVWNKHKLKNFVLVQEGLNVLLICSGICL